MRPSIWTRLYIALLVFVGRIKHARRVFLLDWAKNTTIYSRAVVFKDGDEEPRYRVHRSLSDLAQLVLSVSIRTCYDPIGRWIWEMHLDMYEKNLTGEPANSKVVLDLLPAYIQALNKPLSNQEFLYEHKAFFMVVQGLHDGYWYWTDQGLSERGEEKLKTILREYCT